MPPLANQLAEIQRQQQVLKVLQETQSSLEGFRNTVTGVLEPSTGHVDVDYLVGEARGLLGELSETIGGLLEPLNQVSAATSGITHTLQGIATLVETGRRVDQLTGPELAEQFTRYVSHLTGAAQAVGVLNPVIGSYLTVLGEGLNGMGENLKIIAARAEVTNQVVTEERLRAFGEFVERAVQVQPARPSEGSDALRREADRLWERQQDLWNEFRHSDWAIDQALIELRPDWPDHERRAWVKWFPEAWSSVAKAISSTGWMANG